MIFWSRTTKSCGQALTPWLPDAMPRTIKKAILLLETHRWAQGGGQLSEWRCSETPAAPCSGRCDMPPDPSAAPRLTAETLPGHCPWPKGTASPKARRFPSSSLHPVTGQCGGQCLALIQDTLKGYPSSKAPCAISWGLSHNSITI